MTVMFSSRPTIQLMLPGITPGPISTTRIDEAFVHETPEQLVGLVFAQADALTYECDIGVGVYLVPSTLALVDSLEHRSALVIGKFCRHYAPLPLVPPPIVRLPDRTATRPRRRLSARQLDDGLGLHLFPTDHSTKTYTRRCPNRRRPTQCRSRQQLLLVPSRMLKAPRPDPR